MPEATPSQSGMEHRWRVPYTRLWPKVHDDYYETSAESSTEAREKVAALLNRQSAGGEGRDWRWNGDPELIL